MQANEDRPDWADMQGLALSAYSHLDCARYLLYRIEDASAAQAWLRGLAEEVTPALKPPRGRNATNDSLNVALSHSGLRTLCGARQAQIENFPLPFVQGIDGSDHRKRILGDTGCSDPHHWRWGGAHRPVDILLMLFSSDEHRLRAASARYAPSRGVAEVSRIDAVPLARMRGREHFGFLDGVSQPVLVGTRAAERHPESRHLTALGEIALGYVNADGARPPLPSLTTSPDFCRNGTFLVARQLEQHVEAFWDFVRREAGGEPLAADHLAAKIVGRRRDGTPLVPYTDPTDNEFGFAADPFGYGCPMGSHIRRANPRDTLADTNVPRPSVIAGNRHRVLRRGRSYERAAEADGGARERGLLFLCLNADLERQFEFVQKDWINNPGFAGLAGERDPLVGDQHGCGVFTVQGLPAPVRVTCDRRFVTVRGGEYFFLPGLRALRHLAGDRGAGGPHA